jgi:tetratricopeptide (TPR) repeat protein
MQDFVDPILCMVRKYFAPTEPPTPQVADGGPAFFFFLLFESNIFNPMQKLIHTVVFSLGLAVMAGSFSSCSESRADNADVPIVNASQETKGDIPRLLTRADGLGSVDEEIHVGKIYDEQVARLHKDANDAEARLKLAELFMNEARITGEHPYYYPKALEMLRGIPAESFKSPDQQFRALYLESSVQLSLHDFAEAFVTGEKAKGLFPYNAGIYGVLVDAEVEMGHYKNAVDLCDKMVGMRPDLRSYARVSYLREIHGEVDGAIEAMKMAVSAGMPGYEQTAWCRLNLAQLYEKYGTMDEAKEQFEILLIERPHYPFAYAGLARVAMAKGDYQDAATNLDQAISLIPEVGFYEQKAELHRLLGEDKEAEALYPEILSMMKEDSDAGHNMDLEIAKVHLSLGGNADKALEYAKKAAIGREDNIEVNATLADIYLAKGDKKLAKAHLQKAMATGSKNPEYLALSKKM